MARMTFSWMLTGPGGGERGGEGREVERKGGGKREGRDEVVGDSPRFRVKPVAGGSTAREPHFDAPGVEYESTPTPGVVPRGQCVGLAGQSRRRRSEGEGAKKKKTRAAAPHRVASALCLALSPTQPPLASHLTHQGRTSGSGPAASTSTARQSRPGRWWWRPGEKGERKA